MRFSTGPWMRVFGMFAATSVVAVAAAQSTPPSPAQSSGVSDDMGSREVPDLSGVWMLSAPRATFSEHPAPPMTPWAAQRFEANRPTMGPRAALDANDPTVKCLPPGLPYVLLIPTPFEIVQTEKQVLQLFEYDHTVRRIHTDGRNHPEDLRATGMYQWTGYSVGRWEGETLVVETVGFNDRTWLDRAGHPHSQDLRVIERIRRIGHDRLVIDVIVKDPKAYTGDWEGQLTYDLRPDWEMFEHICVSEDNGDEEYFQYRDRAWQAVP